MKAPLTLVAAVGENGVIGVDGGLPWRVRADLRKFRAVTMGKPIIMGRKTFESIGRVLEGRDVIVVTRGGDAPAGVFVAASLEEAIRIGEERAESRGVDEICVVGGGEIYAQAMPLAERLHVTHVAARPQGDTRFPPIDPSEWIEIAREALPATAGDTATAIHVTYRRRH